MSESNASFLLADSIPAEASWSLILHCKTLISRQRYPGRVLRFRTFHPKTIQRIQCRGIQYERQRPRRSPGRAINRPISSPSIRHINY
jgi:hypothetical protein